MANQLMNQCVTVQIGGATLTLAGSAEAPYFFKVFYDQSDGKLSEGTSVVLTKTGDCRVVAWDGEPGSATVDFTAESSVASGYSLTLDGELSLVANDERDPWPPT